MSKILTKEEIRELNEVFMAVAGPAKPECDRLMKSHEAIRAEADLWRKRAEFSAIHCGDIVKSAEPVTFGWLVLEPDGHDEEGRRRTKVHGPKVTAPTLAEAIDIAIQQTEDDSFEKLH